MPRYDFQDKVVIITGASSGIGRELAYQLAALGACLSLAARNEERLEAAKAECLWPGWNAAGNQPGAGGQSHAGGDLRPAHRWGNVEAQA